MKLLYFISISLLEVYRIVYSFAIDLNFVIHVYITIMCSLFFFNVSYKNLISNN